MYERDHRRRPMKRNDATAIEEKIIGLQNRLNQKCESLTKAERQKLQLELEAARHKLWNGNRHAAAPTTKSTWR